MTITKMPHGLYQAKVGRNSYEFEKWGAEDAIDGLMDLGKLLAVPLSEAKGIRGDTNIADESVTRVLGMLVGQLSDNRPLVMALLKKLVANGVQRDGRTARFEDEEYLDLSHLFEVAKTALEVQYGGFFGAKGGALDMLRKLRPEPPPPPSAA